MRDVVLDEKLIIGRNGRVIAVLLDIDDYRGLVSELEEHRVDALRSRYDETGARTGPEVFMVATSLPAEIAKVVEGLDRTAQEQVLELARALEARRLRGTPGRDLLRLAGTMSTEDADELQAIIDDGCGNEREGAVRKLA